MSDYDLQLFLHCVLRLVCPNTQGKYGMITNQSFFLICPTNVVDKIVMKQMIYIR